MTPEEEREVYIKSEGYKKELKAIIIVTIILVIIAVIVAIIKSPHYTPEQLACIKNNPWNKYMCGA